jgi:regulator of sigma E protease
VNYEFKKPEVSMGVLSFLISAVAVIIVFGLVIFIHELGHFLAAKRFGVKVNSFALGMGPAVWKKQKGETEYSFRAIPIGGYVKMEGEDGEFSGGDGVALESENGGRRTDGRAFYDKKPWQRFIILVSGAVMNIILGFLITILLNSLYTDVLPTTVVDALTPGYGAETVGIKPGDKIIKIYGDGVHNTTDINIALMLARKDEASVLIERNGERLSFTVPVKWNGEKYVLGFTPLLSQ